MAYAVAKKVLSIDKKLLKRFHSLNAKSFSRLWISSHDYNKHVRKRMRNKDIQSIEEYFNHAKDAIEHPKELFFLQNRRSKLLYIGKEWVDIVLDNAKLITSFKLKEPIEEILKKERLHRLKIARIDPKTLLNNRKIKKK